MGVDKALYLDHPSISALVERALPFPTIKRAALLYLFPKPGRQGVSGIQARMVAGNKPNRLPFDMTKLRVCLAGNGRESSATALAVTVWNIVRGMIGVHRNLSFLCHARGHRKCRPGASIGAVLQVYFTTFCLEMQCYQVSGS